MALPEVDFAAIAGIAHDAIQSYGTSAEFVELDSQTGRTIKCVVYQDKTAALMVQDADSVPALALLDPADFSGAYRSPQQFDSLRLTVGAFTGIWTINADPHPVFAGDELPIFLCELRRN